jgi:hypothetical protein
MVMRDSSRARLAATLETLTAAHLLFPVAIMAIAVAGFMLEHRMSVWVTPLGAAVTTVTLRLFSPSWRAAAVMAVLAALIHVVAGLLAVMLPDRSWDGLAYHQEAILRLAHGWNPLFEDSDLYGVGNGLFLNHYPKHPWIAGAAALLSTGYVETGKLFNVTLMIAAGVQVVSVLLRLTALSVPTIVSVGMLAALNPVTISQSMTFYVDGAVASVLTVLIAGLIVSIAAPRWRSLCVALLAACVAINMKFTAVAYTAVLMSLAACIAWRYHGLRSGSWMAAAAVAAGVVGVLVLGYSPYVRNLREKGDLFYPVSATPETIGLGATGGNRPTNLEHKDRFSRFLISAFSRSEIVRPPRETRLKFPLWIGRDERRGIYGADLEAGGFGPLYGALLLVAGAGALALVVHPSTRRIGGLMMLIAACLMTSVFVHTETWWARYVPQAWLVPVLAAIPALAASRWSIRWCLGCALTLLAAANLLVVGVNVAWRQIAYTRSTRIALEEMSAAPAPVTVYLGPFRSLRQRLQEAGVAFTIVEAPPALPLVRRVLPTPGDTAFWFEE